MITRRAGDALFSEPGVPDPEAFRSLKNISRPKNTTTKPKRILMVLASPVFRKNIPGMEPAITRRLRGIQIFGRIPFRSVQAIHRLEG